MIKIIQTHIEFNMKWVRISDTDYIKILLSKWDFFIMCLWFEAENEKRKEKYIYVRMEHWQDHFDRISFYMTLYYKMTKRRERRIRHMVFRWINVWKSNVYWPHYVKFSFSILYMYMYQVKKDKDGAETDILSNLKNGIIWSMYLFISNQRLEGEGQPRPLTFFRTTMISSIIFVKNRILNWLIVTWQ